MRKFIICFAIILLTGSNGFAAKPVVYDSFYITQLGQENSRMAVGIGLTRVIKDNISLGAKYYGFSEVLSIGLGTYHSFEINGEINLFSKGSKPINPYIGVGIGYLSEGGIYVPLYFGIDFLQPNTYSSIYIELSSIRDKRVYVAGWRIPDLITAFYGVNN